jgi:hypothetical protein
MFIRTGIREGKLGFAQVFIMLLVVVCLMLALGHWLHPAMKAGS